jgi:hypothetical protein
MGKGSLPPGVETIYDGVYDDRLSACAVFEGDAELLDECTGIHVEVSLGISRIQL